MRDLSPGVRAVPMIDVYVGASLAGRSGALVELACSEPAAAVARRLDGIDPYWHDGYPDSLEVIVLADRLGLIFEAPRCLFGERPAKLRQALRPVKRGAFPCEVPAFLARLRERLSILREDSTKLDAYLRFLSDVWRALEPGYAAGYGARVIDDVSVGDLPETHAAHTLPGARRRLAESYAPEQVLIIRALMLPCTGFGIMLEGRAIVGIPFGQQTWNDTAHAKSLQIARRHAVLADPTRVMILAHLGRRERSVTQIATELHMTQPNATRHIKVLLDAGLIEPRREGRLTYYYAPESALREHFERAARDLATLTIW